jgi:hypothetical protein
MNRSMASLSNIAAAECVSQSRLPPLKLAVVLEAAHAPGWVYYLIEGLTNCKHIELFFIILNDNPKVATGADRAPVLFRFWAALDRWVRRSKTDALQLRDCGSLLNSGSIPLVLSRTYNTTPLEEAGISQIREANLDLILHLGSGVFGDKLPCARLGTWSVHQQGQHGAAAIPGQFWDMYEGNHVTRYGPEVIERRENWTRVVYRSATITNFLSLALNQNAACWDIARFLLTELSAATRPWTGRQMCLETNANQCSVRRSVDNIQMAGFLAYWTIRILRHEIEKRIFREQWSIVLQPKADKLKLNLRHSCIVIRPPRDRFYADPFLIEKDGRHYVFFEDYSFESQKGVVSCCEVDAHGNCSDPRVVLEREYHLSYPFLFTWQGEHYMIPETRDNGTIEMYRASNFPNSWVREAVLMSGVAACDSTLFHYRDKWWLFTAGVLDHTSPNERLYLFFASSPLGPWTAHPKNPIVSDARHARPAGCLYFDNEQLIRPGQDCSKGYGYATQLHRVDVLSETDYQETLIASITSESIPGCRGIHTFNQNAKFRVIDCRFLISRFNFNFFPSFRESERQSDKSFIGESAKNSR